MIEDLCNQALDLIGYKGRRIGNIYDGTRAARVALEHYSETRREAFHLLKPDWAKRDKVLTLLKSAPAQYDPNLTPWNNTYPPIPWKYEYAYPDDCTVALQIKETPFFIPLWKPRANVFRIYNETGSFSILSNVANAILVYIADEQNFEIWHEDFTLQFVMMLAKKFQAALGEVQHERNPDNSGGRNQQGAG